MAFKKAIRENLFLRLVLMGIPGAGKTYTALSVAQGLAPDSVAVIDTEGRSASKYAHLFSFDVEDMSKPTTDNMIKAIREAAAAKYKLLIIDSASHQWLDLVDEVGRMSKQDFSGNQWAAWSKGRPKQTSFMRAILDYPGHVIVTMRVSTEWATETDAKGKQKPVRVGLKPQAERNSEYEFDMVITLDHENVGTVLKDRTGKFQGCEIPKPDAAFGAMLKEWLNTGEAVKRPAAPETPEPSKKKPFLATPKTVRQLVNLFAELEKLGLAQEQTLAYIKASCGSDQLRDMPQAQFDCAIAKTVDLLDTLGVIYDDTGTRAAGLTEDERESASKDAVRAAYDEAMFIFATTPNLDQ